MNLPLNAWFDKDADLRKLGFLKLGHMVSAEQAILSKFPPFWNSFKPYLKKLIVAFFPAEFVPTVNPFSVSEITPKKMIDILKDAAEHVHAGTVEVSDDYGDDFPAFNDTPDDTTSHSYIPRKRARKNETSEHQSKKGKKLSVRKFTFRIGAYQWKNVLIVKLANVDVDH